MEINLMMKINNLFMYNARVYSYDYSLLGSCYCSLPRVEAQTEDKIIQRRWRITRRLTWHTSAYYACSACFFCVCSEIAVQSIHKCTAPPTTTSSSSIYWHFRGYLLETTKRPEVNRESSTRYTGILLRCLYTYLVYTCAAVRYDSYPGVGYLPSAYYGLPAVQHLQQTIQPLLYGLLESSGYFDHHQHVHTSKGASWLCSCSCARVRVVLCGACTSHQVQQ